MNLKEIVSISGLGGLHKIISQRGDGLIVHSFDDGKSRFVPSRTHIFTPLEGITIYTKEDNVELTKVLAEMKKQADKNPPVEGKAGNEEHKEYMRSIVPDFDEEKVYVSDIKKLIKWYHILAEQNLLTEEEPEAEEAAEDKKSAKKAAKAEKETEEEKPAKKAAKAEKETEEQKPAAKKAKDGDAKGTKKTK